MIEPKRIWRTASGKPSDRQERGQDVRISAPTIVPAKPPRPPMIDVPPMTAAATDGSTYDVGERHAGDVGQAGDRNPAIAARTPESTYRTIRTCHAAGARQARRDRVVADRVQQPAVARSAAA